jgi:drug/metabolite transporter (DMT)-like permease
VLFQRSVRRSGVVLSATFMKLSLLVTMLISVVFFGEQPGTVHWLGFLLAVGAIILINYDGSGLGGFQPALLVLLLIGGLCDGMSKVYEELGTASLSPQFLFYTFLVAMVLCAALAWRKQQLPGKWEWIYGLAIGIPNFYSARFMLLALKTIPGVIAYPVYSVAGILLVTLAGLILFREKLSRRQWLALGIILISLVLLNI